MIYFTFGNQSSGVYASYVTELCKYMNSAFGLDVRIISFVSVRGYFKVRKQRKALYPNTIVLPAVPKASTWRWNLILLAVVWMFKGKRNVIALSPIAAQLALWLRRLKLVDKVVYDGEGATAAEWNEYDVVNNEKLQREIYDIEARSVLEADFRRTVSSKMIVYWRETFNYQGNEHVIIPCTLNSVFLKVFSEAAEIKKRREAVGCVVGDIVFVYSGSSAQWQSLQLIDDILLKILKNNPSAKVLMLTDSIPADMEIVSQFPHRVKCKWVEHHRVREILEVCDYGLLIRENTVTNKVAAPTKFAEYLSCGLKVLISPQVGDYSQFVTDHDCGSVIDNVDSSTFVLPVVDYQEKKRIHDLALKYFSKGYFRGEFERILKIFCLKGKVDC